MSSQTIRQKTRCNLIEEYEKKVLLQGKSYLLKTFFDLGGEFCADKAQHDLTVLKILRSEVCENLKNVQRYYIHEGFFENYESTVKIKTTTPTEPIIIAEFSSEFSSEFNI